LPRPHRSAIDAQQMAIKKRADGMANSIWTTEEFTCPSCGMDYTATREEQQDKRSSSFNCMVCGTEVHAWTGNFDFFNWKGIKRKSPVFGKKQQAPASLGSWSLPPES
jgi:predicted RNA-binding Zn-ribbon protein involved in translation (DUF1610 family)